MEDAALAAFVRAHPEMDEPCQVEGVWRAWLPVGDNGGGFEMHGRTEEELLAKLEDVV
jgi:hypothetical protein